VKKPVLVIFKSGLIKILPWLYLLLVFFSKNFIQSIQAQEPANPPPLYGMVFASITDFPKFKDWGINLVETTLSLTDQSNWKSVYDAAVANNIKLIPLLWVNPDTVWTQNFEAGRPFLTFLKNNPQYLNATYALHMTHEPFGVPGQTPETLKQLNAKIKGIIPSIKIYCEGCITGDANFNRTWMGVADAGHQGVYPFSSAGNNWERERNMLEVIRQSIEEINPNFEVVIYAQTFKTSGGGWNKMPNADEMRQLTQLVFESSLMKNNHIVGFAWYTWEQGGPYSDYLSKHTELYPVVREIYDTYFANGISPSPSMTPSKAPSPSILPSATPIHDPCLIDLNADQVVNAPDVKLLLSRWLTQNTGNFNFDTKINSWDFALLLKFWGQTCGSLPSNTPAPSASLPPGTLSLYGVKFASTSDYQELAGLGVMNPVTIVSSNSAVDSVISAARTIRNSYPNFKPILWQYPEGWTCDEGVNDTGRSFVTYLDSKNYWNDILAIYGLHEPMGTYWGRTYCGSLSEIKSVHDDIRALSNYDIKIFGKMYSDTSYKNAGYIDGICDYCAVMYHPYRYSPHEFRKTQMLSDLNRDLNIFKSVPAGVSLNKFTPYLCTIHWPNTGVYGTGLYMPTAAEMLDGGSSIINYVSSQGYRVDGFVWYTWGNNSSWIGLDQYNDDGQRGDAAAKTGRMGVIKSLGGL